MQQLNWFTFHTKYIEVSLFKTLNGYTTHHQALVDKL